ncbi:Zn-ribbon domain-containing OB-fold protein [Sneathiella sp.]|uniref:Zn-ribbon domain-containing OB-fold protein n=1 Tax=Sneathiella sp. TaxID=1964365 RepID=UPI0026190752|nr:Zn-ribbon domain-containing OB-fold protein [Sneathiella sp.]MDF2368470.1 Zn-ribbon domain-containing OB-fold protein [Sneathiella sp.]
MSPQERTYQDPDINMETERYWEGSKNGQLLMKKCNACGKTHFYPRTICPVCSSSDTEWYEASGKGKIYSYSIMRRAKIPYVMAYVTLDEGVTMMTNIVESDFDDVKIGKAVEVTFRDTEGNQSLPVFRLCK